jgi:hypothetical protein
VLTNGIVKKYRKVATHSIYSMITIIRFHGNMNRRGFNVMSDGMKEDVAHPLEEINPR